MEKFCDHKTLGTRKVSENSLLHKIKKELEEFVSNGVLEEGFVVNQFKFSIPKEVENFLALFANDVHIMHILLETYISKEEKVEFEIEYIKGKTLGKYSEFINFLEQIEEVRYRKFPKSFLNLNAHFLISQLPESSRRILRANRNLFTDYREDSLYISLYLEIKSFTLDFDYYGKIL